MKEQNELKFNRNYTKLHNQKSGLLVGIFVAYKKDLTQEFVDYDTDGCYKLDENKAYMLLVFLGNKNIPFTTLRRYNEENMRKYHSGKVYRIVIEREIKGGLDGNFVIGGEENTMKIEHIGRVKDLIEMREHLQKDLESLGERGDDELRINGRQVCKHFQEGTRETIRIHLNECIKIVDNELKTL